MNILTIDSCMGSSSVCLSEAGEQRYFECDTNHAAQAEMLVPMIEKALEAESLLYSDLCAIAVTIGPGSFTGVRIGLATARGMKLATGLPLIGVSTLEALAITVLSDKPITAVIDARRGQCYVQQFQPDLTPVLEPEMLDWEDLPQKLGEGDRVIVTNAPKQLPENTANVTVAEPDAANAAKVAWMKWQKGIIEATPQPLYIRPPDAKLPSGASHV